MPQPAIASTLINSNARMFTSAREWRTSRDAAIESPDHFAATIATECDFRSANENERDRLARSRAAVVGAGRGPGDRLRQPPVLARRVAHCAAKRAGEVRLVGEPGGEGDLGDRRIALGELARR